GDRSTSMTNRITWTIMAWAREHGHVVFTHDSISAPCSLTRESGPRVVQVRAHDVLPGHIGQIVITTIRMNESELRDAAIVTVDQSRSRVRILPLRRNNP
ncbi:MAG: hypothetical protein ABIS29_02025, partial [Vicinamibacterales bacterium]